MKKFILPLIILMFLCGCTKKQSAEKPVLITVENEQAPLSVVPDMSQNTNSNFEDVASEDLLRICKIISGYNITNTFNTVYAGGCIYYAQFQDAIHGFDITATCYTDKDHIETFYAEQVAKYSENNVFNNITEQNGVTYMSNDNNLACMIFTINDTLVVYTYSLDFIDNGDAYDFCNKLRG